MYFFKILGRRFKSTTSNSCLDGLVGLSQKTVGVMVGSGESATRSSSDFSGMANVIMVPTSNGCFTSYSMFPTSDQQW